MIVQTQTEEVRRLRADEPRADLHRPQRLLPAAVPEQVPEPHRHPGLPQGQRRGQLARVAPGSSSGRSRSRRVLGRVCPAPCEEHCRRDEVDEAIAIRDSHRYAGDQVIKAMLDDGVDPPLPFERQAPTGRRAAVIGSGPAGMAAAYYLLLAGHDVTVFERDPAPGGMLRYGIPQYRLPKVEVLEAEYESVTRLGGKIVCNAGLGRDFTLDDLPEPGLRRGRRRDRLLRHEQARHPGRGRRRGPRRPGVPAHRDARPARIPGHAGKRVVVIGGGFTSMDCSRTSIRQGAAEVTLVYRRDMKDMPASNEVHEAIEEGVTAIFQAGPSGSSPTKRQGDRRRVHPDAAGRARRIGPAPAGAGARDGVHDPVRPRAAGHRPGPGARLDRARAPRASRRPSSAASRPTRSRSRPAGRASSAPATSGSARRPSSRRSPRAAAPPTPWTPSSRAWTWPRSGRARRSPSRSRSSSRSCRSRARSRSRATG